MQPNRTITWDIAVVVYIILYSFNDFQIPVTFDCLDRFWRFLARFDRVFLENPNICIAREYGVYRHLYF